MAGGDDDGVKETGKTFLGEGEREREGKGRGGGGGGGAANKEDSITTDACANIIV